MIKIPETYITVNKANNKSSIISSGFIDNKTDINFNIAKKPIVTRTKKSLARKEISYKII